MRLAPDAHVSGTIRSQGEHRLIEGIHLGQQGAGPLGYQRAVGRKGRAARGALKEREGPATLDHPHALGHRLLRDPQGFRRCGKAAVRLDRRDHAQFLDQC